MRSAVRGVSLAAASGEPSALAAALRRCDELRVDELDGDALAAMDSAVEEDAGEDDHAAWAWRRAEIEGGVQVGGTYSTRPHAQRTCTNLNRGNASHPRGRASPIASSLVSRRGHYQH